MTATPDLNTPISTATRRQILGGVAVAAAGLTAASSASAHAAPGLAPASTMPAASLPGSGKHGGVPGVDRGTINRWARDTWASMVAMTDSRTGLPADNISGPLKSPTRSGYTSPTNIGGYLWSAVVARELGIISTTECRKRLTKTLTTT